MTPETTTYIYIASTLIASAVYYLTFRYQAKKIDILEKTIKSQSTLLTDFETFKKLLDVDHYVKNRDLQLENQKIQLTRFFEVEAKKMGERIVENMGKSYIETNKELLAMVQELVQIPLSIVMQNYPDKSQKLDRDNYIKEKFPSSSKMFIGFCDAWVSGQIDPDGLGSGVSDNGSKKQ